MSWVTHKNAYKICILSVHAWIEVIWWYHSTLGVWILLMLGLPLKNTEVLWQGVNPSSACLESWLWLSLQQHLLNIVWYHKKTISQDGLESDLRNTIFFLVFSYSNMSKDEWNCINSSSTWKCMYAHYYIFFVGLAKLW